MLDQMLRHGSCKAFYWLRAAGITIVTLSAESLLVIRTISLYTCSRKGNYKSVLLTAAEVDVPQSS
jgi:hypothetical protein